MIIEIIIFSILGIILFKGKFSNLKEYSFNDIKGKKLFLAGVILNILLFSFSSKSEFIYHYFYEITVLAFILIIAGFLCNYNNPGFLLIAAGFTLNLLPIVLNGKMPVDYNALLMAGNQEKIYYITHGYSLSHGIFEHPKLRILTDIIPLKPPYYNPKVISIGDILISAGIVLAIIIISRRNK